MPPLAFLAVAGLVLLALLFVSDATLQESSPPIATSSRVGLPERWHSDGTQVLISRPAREPDMTSPAIRAAQPKPDHEALGKIAPAARAARAEAPSEDRPAGQPMGSQENRGGDRFSIGNQ